MTNEIRSDAAISFYGGCDNERPDPVFPLFSQLWSLSVPQATAPLNLGDTMVDWLGGQRWLWTAAGDAPAAQRIRSAVHAVHAVHGNATVFIAANANKTRATARFDTLTPPLDRIHRQLKAEFDPAGIFNPGRLPWFA